MPTTLDISLRQVLTADETDEAVDAADVWFRAVLGESAVGHVATPSGGMVLVSYVPPDVWAVLQPLVEARGLLGPLAEHMRTAGLDDALQAAAADD